MKMRKWESYFVYKGAIYFELFLLESALTRQPIHDKRFEFALFPEKLSYSHRNYKKNNNFTTTKTWISM